MELKVWVEGIQRIVCGVTEVTTCQVAIIALNVFPFREKVNRTLCGSTVYALCPSGDTVGIFRNFQGLRGWYYFSTSKYSFSDSSLNCV